MALAIRHSGLPELSIGPNLDGDAALSCPLFDLSEIIFVRKRVELLKSMAAFHDSCAAMTNFASLDPGAASSVVEVTKPVDQMVFNDSIERFALVGQESESPVTSIADIQNA